MQTHRYYKSESKKKTSSCFFQCDLTICVACVHCTHCVRATRITYTNITINLPSVLDAEAKQNKEAQ